MNGFQDFFKNKEITVMGLGLLGRGVGDTAFLAECGADVTVTDLKGKEELAESLAKLNKFKNIKYSLGGHNLKDFRGKDMILKSAGVPCDSIYIKEARKNGIPVEMSAALVGKLSGATIVGITGTRGKSTITKLIFDIVSAQKERRVFLGGNIRGIATLPILKKVEPEDIVVMELDSWQLQGFREEKISPNISVFSNFMPDHMNYYKNSMRRYFCDKENIFKYQKEKDCLIAGESAERAIKKFSRKPKSKFYLARAENIPRSWKIKISGAHNRENIALAATAAKILGVKKSIIKSVVQNYGGMPGRLEFLRSIRGIRVYNDNNATTPDATIAALKTFRKKVILIAGGSDKNLKLRGLEEEIRKRCKAVVLLSGSGTNRLDKRNFEQILEGEKKTLFEAVKSAIHLAKEGDTVLFSPAFASFGSPPGGFRNEYERNDRFVKIIEGLN